jgi:tryptophan synthase beta subunit
MEKGRYGIHGGQYIPELLMSEIQKLEQAYEFYKQDAEFNAEFDATAGVHTYDGVHANTAGYNVITKYIAPWLESVFAES